MQRIGGQLRRVALGRRQAPDRLIDLVDPDPGRVSTPSPSTISATAAVAALVAPHPSASKVTLDDPPLARSRGKRATDPRKPPPRPRR